MHLRTVLDDLTVWMQEQDWPSLAETRATNNMLMLQGWRG
jgi:hypothetical protein